MLINKFLFGVKLLQNFECQLAKIEILNVFIQDQETKASTTQGILDHFISLKRSNFCIYYSNKESNFSISFFDCIQFSFKHQKIGYLA